MKTNENAENGNWIKISRKILDWEWYGDTNTFRVFVDLLLNAQYKDTRYRGNLIKRGQIITSVNAISERTGLSAQNIRTAMEHLQSTGEINKQTNKQTNKHFTIITICKYDTYQDKSEEANEQSNNQSNNQPTINQQHTRNKEIKNNKSDNAHTRMHTEFSLEDALTKITEETKIRYEKIETVFCAIKEAYAKVMENNFLNSGGNYVNVDSFVKFVLKRVIPGCTEMEKRLLRTNFSLKDVIDEINSHWSEKRIITEGSDFFSYIKGIYEKKLENNFVKNDGTKYTLGEITSFIEKKLTEDSRTYFRIDLDNAPFRYYSLIKELNDESPLVKWYVVEKYRRFRASGFKTNKGSVTDLSFFRKMLPEFKKEIKEKFKFENII